MSKITIVYWSQTGNTEMMAKVIAKGVTAGGANANVLEVGKASMDELKASEVFALGCPAMGAESLEESEMEPFVCKVEEFAEGKKIALFGSYGWGDGEWMRVWEDRMKKAGAQIVSEEGLIVQDSIDSQSEEACINLGKTLANL